MKRALSSLIACAVVTSTSVVAFAAPKPDEDIRDIHGPIAIPHWWIVPLAIALATLATIAIVLLVRFWRARRARAMTALERALASLEIAEVHAREGRAREWAEIVAGTTRGALANRLGAAVLPQTTAEIAHTYTTEADAARVIELLETCDLARFAKAKLDASALLASTTVAREVAERLFAPQSTSPQPVTS